MAKATGASIQFAAKQSDGAPLQINASVQWDTPTFTASSFNIFLPNDTPPTLPNGPHTPSLYVECTPNPIPSGATAVCSAHLPHIATGAVSFSLDGNTWTDATVDSTGIAVSTGVPAIASGGAHTIVASYSGDSNFVAVNTPISISEISGGTLPSDTVYSFSITKPDGSSGYDAVSNVVAYTDSVNGTWGVNGSGAGTLIKYDDLNRLVLATQTLPGGAPQYTCWSYDSFGNVQQQFISNQPFTSQPGQSCVTAQGAVVTQTQMNYAGGTNRITSGGWKNSQGIFNVPGSPTYDASGNMANDLQNNYLYTPDGQVCAVQQPTAYGIAGPLIGYLYDAEGQRVAKGNLTSFSCDPTANGFQATSVYITGPDGQEMTEVDGSDNWVHTNVSAGGNMIATYKNDGLGVHFQLADWLGTRRVQTDYLGQMEDSCQSQPFGDGLTCSGPDVDVSKHHYTGKERDTESGLDYFGARYYASNTGRFMSPDWAAQAQPVPYATMGNPQTLNLYSYMHNNPLSGTDPDGHCDGGSWWCDAWHSVKNGFQYGHFTSDTAKAKSLYDNDPEVKAANQWWAQNGQDAMNATFLSIGIYGATSVPGAPEGEGGGWQVAGQWEAVNESMSESAAAYQEQITGASSDQSFVVGGVKFDGVNSTGLLDAKGPGYSSFVSNGEFKPWFQGADALVSQAQRQIGAANGAPITWHVAEQDSAAAIQNLLQSRGVQGVTVVYTPPK